MNARDRDLAASEVARVFRALSDEHVDARTESNEVAFRRLEARLHPGLVLVSPPRRPWFERLLGTRLAPARGWVLGGAVAGLAALAVSLWPRHAIEFEVLGAPQGGLIATEADPATLVFSDDSRVEIGPNTTLRVEVEGDERVVARLSQGTLDVRVEHGPDTDYRFRAGSHEVRVIGTAFRLAFDPERDRLEVDLREGRVLVADRSERTTPVRAGQKVTFEAGRKHEADEAGSVGSPASASEQRDAATTGTSGSTGARGGEQRAETSSANAAAKSAPARMEPTSFAHLVAEGRFREAVDHAKSRGIERVLGEASGQELHELAQAAHYTGEGALAERTWKRIRERFAGQSVATNAAFFLGRLTDRAPRRAEARAYFDAYLREAPRGAYAAEALGRKLALVRKLDGDQAARGVAKEYLSRHPKGPYAAEARSLVER